MKLTHRFVEFIPEQIEENVLYISIEYCTAIHKCVCGCGNEVVTPLSPTDWEIRFNGQEVSLSPSIGNWNFECKSHYWIIKNEVRFTRKWSAEQIDQNRKKDAKHKTKYYKRKKGS